MSIAGHRSIVHRAPPNEPGVAKNGLCQRLEQIHWQEWNAMLAICPEPAKPLLRDSGQRLWERLREQAIAIINEAEELRGRLPAPVE